MPTTRHTNGQAEDRKTYWRHYFHKVLGLGFKLTLNSFVFYNAKVFCSIVSPAYCTCCACQLTSVWAAYCKNTASLRNFLSFLFNSLQLPDFSTKLQSSNLHEEKAKLQFSVKTMHCNDGYSINKRKSSMLYVPKLNCWTLKNVKSRHSILDQNKVPSKYSSFLFRLPLIFCLFHAGLSSHGVYQ